MAEGTAIVMDRGITRQENLDDLAQKGWHWMTVDRQKPKAVPSRPCDATVSLSKKTLQAW